MDLRQEAENNEAYCADVTTLEQHAYLPFIRKNTTERRFRSKYDDAERSEPLIDSKTRPIDIPSHRDAAVFGMFAAQISTKLEEIYEREQLGSAVAAFRPISTTNIHVAKAAFDDIRSRPEGCVAVSLDIQKFYPSVPHKQLKSAWAAVLGVKELPLAEYRAFRAITRYTYVERTRLFDRLDTLWRATEFPKPKSLAARVCTMREFRTLRQQQGKELLLKTNDEGFGIPQGAALSNVLTNALMLSIDRLVNRRAQELGGSYRRYCDDVLIIGSEKAVGELETLFTQQVQQLGMDIHTHYPKRTTATFCPQPNGKLCLAEPNRLMHYLGFTFDGSHILIRSNSIARYYQRMAKAVRRAIRKAEKAELSRVPRKRLYARYTSLGDLGPGASTANGEPRHRQSFYSYAKRCARILESPAILRQLRHHMQILSTRLKRGDAFLERRYPPVDESPLVIDICEEPEDSSN